MSMTSINISLPESMKNYIEEQIAQGSYSTTSEYFRELIQNDQKRKAQEHLETLLLQGLESGEATPMEEKDWQTIRQSVRERIINRTESNKS